MALTEDNTAEIFPSVLEEDNREREKLFSKTDRSFSLTRTASSEPSADTDSFAKKANSFTSPAETKVEEKTEKNQWKQLGLLFLSTSFFGNGTLGITKAMLSILLKSLGLSGTEIGLISGARGFKAVVDIPAGIVSDKFGRKKAAYLGQFLLVIAHIFMGIGQSFWSLFFARLIHGAGSGFNAGAATFGAADLLKKARGLGQGLLEMANYGSHTIFAAIAGVLALRYGVRAPFFVLGIAPIFGFFIVWKYMKEPRDVAKDEEGKTNINASSHAKKHITLKEAGSFIATLLTKPKMLAIFYAGLLTKFVDEGLLTMLLPLWAQSQGFSIMQIAGIATLSHGSFTAMVGISGWISDKIGRKFTMVLGTIIFAAASLAMPFATTMVKITIVGVILSIGNALVYPAAPAATADVVPSHLRATGLGVYKLIHDVGIFVGPVMMGIILDYAGMSHAFTFASIVFILGTVLLLAFYKNNNSEKESF